MHQLLMFLFLAVSPVDSPTEPHLVTRYQDEDEDEDEDSDVIILEEDVDEDDDDQSPSV